MSRDAQSKLTTHDDGRFVRTAIQLDGEKISSIDVLRSDGTRLCQVNVFPTGVDVIMTDRGIVGTFLAWCKGVQVVRERLPKNTVFAVALLPREPGEPFA